MENIESHTIGKIPNNDLCEIKIKQSKDGYEIMVQSPVIEKYFSRYEIVPNRWSNNEAYGLNRNMESRLYEEFQAWKVKYLLIDDRIPNLSFFRAVGLSQGVRFKINFPTSNHSILKWKKLASQELRRLWRTEIYPISLQWRLKKNE